MKESHQNHDLQRQSKTARSPDSLAGSSATSGPCRRIFSAVPEDFQFTSVNKDMEFLPAQLEVYANASNACMEYSSVQKKNTIGQNVARW